MVMNVECTTRFHPMMLIEVRFSSIAAGRWREGARIHGAHWELDDDA